MEHDVHERFKAIEDRLAEGSDRMGRIEKAQTEISASLNSNTDMTSDIKGAIEAAKAGFKVLGWIGGVFKWLGAIAGGVAAIWALVYAMTHGGKPL